MSHKKIVLAVDDMPENLTIMRSMLADYFDVRLAKSSKMALSLLDELKVDLILLDIEMPGMSGFEFLKRLVDRKSINKNTPVIFVTSHADKKLFAEAVNAGAKAYLLKPITSESLYKKIDAVIGMPEEKINPIEEKLSLLMTVVAAGNSDRAENIVKELVSLAKDRHIQNSYYVEDIERFIKNFEYERGIIRIKEYLDYLTLGKR
jgi:putative two-component system response regulator